MKKISRRLFLLLFLSGSASLYVATRPGSTQSPVKMALRPNSPNNPTVPPTLSPTDPATPVPTAAATVEAAAQGQALAAQKQTSAAQGQALAAQKQTSAAQEPTPVPINVVVSETQSGCGTPVSAPAKPEVIPAEGGVDPVTGRHVMGDVQVLDAASYRLVVTGLVARSLSLTLDDLRCLPKITETVTTTCYAFADTATWSGVQISEVLKKAGVRAGAKTVIQKSADGMVSAVTLAQALDPHNFLAYEMRAAPLPVLFGFPLRSIIVNVAGQFSVKWLTVLEVA